MSTEPVLLSMIHVDPLVMCRRQREYLEAIKPFVDAKAKIYAVNIPTAIIHSGGELEFHYDFTSMERESLRLADEAIDNIKARIFGV